MQIGVRGNGFYTFEFRADDDGLPGEPIPGTSRSFINSSGNVFRDHTFNFVSPVPLPRKGWLTFRVNNSTGGWILTGRDAEVGRTESTYARQSTDGAWQLLTPVTDPVPVIGGFHFVITCLGEAPVGACCDMTNFDDDGENPCRDVPRMNCPFPPRGSNLQPGWVEGARCADDPFPVPCGVAACCRPDDVCEDLTRNQCMAAEPLHYPRLWQPGLYCGGADQSCPYNACLRLEGNCAVARDGTGCRNRFCCTDVCAYDSFCCLVAWDETCLRWVGEHCSGLTPQNTKCFDDVHGYEAQQVEANSRTVFTNAPGYDSSDVPFCCHSGFPSVCMVGGTVGGPCESDEDCPSQYTCRLRTPSPRTAIGAAWFRFVATDTSMRIHTCDTLTPNTDSLVRVFAATDDSSKAAECASLVPLDCGDDAPGCGLDGRHAHLCVGGLVPGRPYYIQVASKNSPERGIMELVVESPCPAGDLRPDHDTCLAALPVTDGYAYVDLDEAYPICPDASCNEPVGRNLWFDYEATCSGILEVGVCPQGDTDAPGTSLAIYDVCHCAIELDRHEACDVFHQEDCGKPLLIPVEQNRCFKIRVSDTYYTPTAATLSITCHPACPQGFARVLDPPSGVVDARIPHRFYDDTALMGISEIRVITPPDSASSCWSLCETRQNPHLHPPYPPDLQTNQVIGWRDELDGTKSLLLRRPITPGETTFLTYSGNIGYQTSFRFTALPGDVNASGGTFPSDILEFIDILNGVSTAPWGMYSTDINHIGAVVLPNVLSVIDLLNGASTYKPWLGAKVDLQIQTCPPQIE